MSHILFILVCCIWGTSFLLMKYASVVYGPLQVSLIRAVCGGAALILAWRFFIGAGKGWPLPRKHWWLLLVIAIIGYAAPYTIQPFAIHHVEQEAGHGSAFGGLIIALVPLLTIAAQAVLLKHWPTTRQWLGVLGGLLCLAYLGRNELQHGVSLSVVLLACLTPLGYATANTLVKKHFHGVPTMVLSASAMVAASVMLLPIAVVADGVAIKSPPVDATAIESTLGATLCLVILGIVSTGIATALFYKLIQREGPLWAGMVGYIIPSVAMGLGFLEGEEVTFDQVIALLGIFAMVALVQVRGKGAKDEKFDVPLEPEV